MYPYKKSRKSSGGWGKIKLELTTLPRFFIHLVYQFNSIIFAIQRYRWGILQFPWQRQSELSLPAVPVTIPATQAAAVVYGCVSTGMSIRLDPWGPGAVAIATLKVIFAGSVVLRKPPGQEKTALRRTWSSYGPPYPLGHWSSDYFYHHSAHYPYRRGVRHNKNHVQTM